MAWVDRNTYRLHRVGEAGRVPQEGIAHRDAGTLAAAGHHGAHADGLSSVEQHDAQLFGVHALHHALGTVLKGDDLAVDRAVHAIHLDDAVGGGRCV